MFAKIVARALEMRDQQKSAPAPVPPVAKKTKTDGSKTPGKPPARKRAAAKSATATRKRSGA